MRKNLASVFHASVLLLIMNFVIHYQSGCGSNVITRSLPVTGQTLDKLNSICFFAITNCQLVNSYLLTHCTNYKFVSLSAYWQRKLANERVENFCSYRRIHIEGWNERSFSERALKTCSRLRLWCVYDIMSFFHFVLRRETGPAVSRSPQEKSCYRVMQASWVHLA